MIFILAIFLFNFYSFIFASVSSNSEHLKQQNSLNNLNGGKINGERNGGGIILILATVLGNILVVLSVCLYKRMRTFTNLLLTSLATADLLVGLLIMPLALLDLLHAHSWPLGIVTCRIWATFDILLCTASILNLCIISLDRYMAITSPLRYPRTRSRWMAFALLCFVWGMSLVVCSPPWFIDEWSISFDSKSSVIFIPPKRTKTRSLSEGIGVENINTAHVISGYQCAYPMSVSYRIYSASCSFYIPLMVMLFVYFKIFRVASERERLIREGMGTCRLSRRVEKTQMKGRKRSATTNYTHRSSVPRIRGGIAQPTTKTVFPGQAKEQQNMLNHCSPVTLANINNININNNHIIPTNRPVSSCEHFYLNQEERRSSSAGQNLLNNENTTEGGDGGDKLSTSCCSVETSCPTSARNSGKGLSSNNGPINRTVAAAVDRAKGSGGSDSFRRKIKSMECLGSGQYDTFGIEGGRKSSKYRKNSADPPVDDNSPERRDSLQQNLHPPDRLILANGARQPLRQQNSYGVNMKTDTLIGH
uniref:G-protein coupled receptors family 1 profile domain-containing protein n=1 Tax=Meloidogyne floridensis TaxID=298350 RepID=A0A915P060_9BILA